MKNIFNQVKRLKNKSKEESAKNKASEKKFSSKNL